MANWKKLITAGALVGAGSYVFSKVIAPKLRVVCVHEDEDACENGFGDDTSEAKNEDTDSDKPCECKICHMCNCDVTIQEVPFEEIPEKVKAVIGALASHVGFDVKPAGNGDGLKGQGHIEDVDKENGPVEESSEVEEMCETEASSQEKSKCEETETVDETVINTEKSK